MLKASEKTDKSDSSPVTIADYGKPSALLGNFTSDIKSRLASRAR